MKTVYFIRHAKSSWADSSLRDHDRPLNKRGLRDAPFMAKLLKGKGANPDLLVSSTANRAQTTALHFAREFNFAPPQLLLKPEIYEAFPDQVMQVIHGLEDQYSEIFIFGHNPAFTSLVNRFTDDYLANLPTCGIGRVVAHIDQWKDFKAPAAQLKDIYFPKQYFT